MTASSVGLDEVKKFWDDRPCNIRHSQKAVGTREYFDEVRVRRAFVEPHIAAFADFSAWKGKRVLEVGCGIGTDGAQFAQAGADYTGVELSSESLAVARQCFAAYGVAGKFFAGNAEELASAVPDGQYDLVYSFGVLHHTPHPDRAIAQIRSLMREGSELRIMLYARYSWKNLLIYLGFDQPEAQYGCPIAYTYSAREVRTLLRDFSEVSIEKRHIFPYRIEAYKNYRYEKAPPWNLVPDSVRNVLARSLGWHLLIRARV